MVRIHCEYAKHSVITVMTHHVRLSDTRYGGSQVNKDVFYNQLQQVIQEVTLHDGLCDCRFQRLQ